jgi:predicted RNA-binding protein with PUA-like domain
MPKQFWLMKSEPDEFSIQDLKEVTSEPWTGVRNYQARNFMRDDMKPGDEILFYHSNTKPPGIAGIGVVVRSAYPDPTQFDKKSNYFDSKATEEEPRWFLVDIGFKKIFKNYLSLEFLKEQKELSDLKILQKGNRLSITPVAKKDFNLISKLGKK